MKFSKSLSVVIEDTLPDWKNQFLSYKNLKKQLKLIYPKDGDKPPHKRPKSESAGDYTDGEVTKEVFDFVKLLEDEMEKFNSFIVDKEEDFVIKWKELQNRIVKAKDSNEELITLGREIVNFHGEMVLLENYSALNYTGLVKILKKYDKRSGALIRFPFIQKVMQQPFLATHVLNKLINECEIMLDRIFSKNESSISSTRIESKNTTEKRDEQFSTSMEVAKDLSEIEYMESIYLRRTQSALQVLKEIRSGSSTKNMFSLPPLQSIEVEDWKKARVVEQIAK